MVRTNQDKLGIAIIVFAFFLVGAIIFSWGFLNQEIVAMIRSQYPLLTTASVTGTEESGSVLSSLGIFLVSGIVILILFLMIISIRRRSVSH